MVDCLRYWFFFCCWRIYGIGIPYIFEIKINHIYWRKHIWRTKM